jgi:histidinol phosphatase-like PHP family hydrolase
MPCPRYDFHIHTKYLGCANETMEVPAIVRECERVGVKTLGITDHLNRFDQVELHRSIRADIEALDTDLDVYFGVELNYTGCDEEFVFNAELKEEYGFQFAIGGIHNPYLTEYDPEKLIEIQHRHHMKTCANPLVEVLVHPYWFGHGEFKKNGWPWAEWMAHIPETFARELGQASRESGTAIEINACANLTNPGYPDDYPKQYVAYLAIIAEEGATFAVGSDAHDIGMLADVAAAWDVVDELGLSEDRVWHPAGAPLKSVK